MIAWLKEFALKYSSGVSALETLLAAVSGLLFSLFSDKIRESFPFYWGPPDDYSGIAIAAWISLLLTVLIVFAHRHWQNQRLREREVELDTRAAELASMIRTQPPPDFLEDLQTVYEAWLTHKAVALKEDDAQSLREAIRKFLHTLVTLIDNLNSHDTIKYGASIMWAVKTSEISEKQKQKVRSSLKFVEAECHLDNLYAVLSYDPDLSVVANVESEAFQESELDEFCIPIPREEQRSAQVGETTRLRVLPGAPVSFCSGDYELFEDTSNLRGWLVEWGSFSDEVIEAVVAHFSKSKIGSFLSVPLKTTSESEPVAIFNIHSDQKNILYQTTAVSFVLVARPLFLILTELLSHLKKIEQRAIQE